MSTSYIFDRVVTTEELIEALDRLGFSAVTDCEECDDTSFYITDNCNNYVWVYFDASSHAIIDLTRYGIQDTSFLESVEEELDARLISEYDEEYIKMMEEYYE